MRHYHCAIAAVAIVAVLQAASCGSSQSAASKADEADDVPSASAANAADDPCLAAANTMAKPRSDAPDKITVSHILIKHASAKNPVSGVTRSRVEACKRAQAARDEILAGASFDSVVAKYSDEPGAGSRNGSLGAIKMSDVDPAFGNAAFDLARGQMSDVVESPSGFHLIMRNE